VSGISIDVSFAVWVVLALTAAAFAAAWYAYRETTPPVSTTWRATLTLLRALALSLIFVLLAGTVLHLSSSTTRLPVLTVLIDDSRSMGITDAAGARSDILSKAVHHSVFSKIANVARTEWITFDGGIREHRIEDSLRHAGTSTDIAAALSAVVSRRTTEYRSAIVLLTDGVYTIGKNPVQTAEDLGLPVYAVGIGDSTEPRDVSIIDVSANELVFAGSKTNVSVRIKSSGFGKEKTEVTLETGGRVIERSSVQLQEGAGEYPVEFSYVPEKEGYVRYTVRVAPLSGERTNANNQRSFTAHVLRSKQRVVIVAGSPDPDVAAIRQSIAEDPACSVQSFVVSMNRWIGPALTQAALDSSDCLVLISFPTSATPQGLVRQIADRLTTSDIPTFVILGPQFDPGRSAGLGDILPFSISSPVASEQQVNIRIAPDQSVHPIIAAGGGEDVWNQLPPVYRQIGLYSAKPGAVILGFARGTGIPSAEPFLAIRTTGGHKSVGVAGYGIWRWKLMAQEDRRTSDRFDVFIGSIIRWLTTPDERKPVRKSASQPEFSEGEPVQLNAQVYDNNSAPVENATVMVSINGENFSLDTELRSTGNGLYSVSIPGLPSGEYSFKGDARKQSAILGDDRGRFGVGGIDAEMQETRMNAGLLRQVANRSGGTYLPPDRLADLDSLLRSNTAFASTTEIHRSDIALWQAGWMLAGVVVLLAIEWLLRKLLGML
jgi:hypothetical protein